MAKIMQTATEIAAVSTQWSQTHCPDGFVINAANGGVVQVYLAAKNLPITLENLTLAVDKLAPNLEWQPGYGPAAPKPARKLTASQERAAKEQRLMDVGVLPQRVLDHANRTESQSDIQFQIAKKQIAAATERMAKGKSAAAAAATAAPAQIPLHATTDDLKKYSATAIRNWIGRRRRAGLAV